jgi:hypothetical protein
MKKLAIVVATLFVLVGCGTSEKKEGEAAAGAASPEVEAAIKEAEAAEKKAASEDGEWRDTSKLLKKAKAAAAKGDNKTALKLAKEAKFQGDMGVQQAKEQEKAGPWLF